MLNNRLAKVLQDWNNENYKQQLKEIKEDLSKWKDIPHLQIKRPNIVKKAACSKLTWNCQIEWNTYQNSSYLKKELTSLF